MNKKIKYLERKITETKEELERLEKEKAKIENTFQNLDVTCPSCGGTGRESFTDAAGDIDTRDCRTCRGLGKISDIKCEHCGNVITADMIWLRRQAFPQCPWCGWDLGAQYSSF
jgi:DnaJ-class molecular chaperone